MEAGAVAVHQHHRRGKVEGARGQYPVGWLAVEGLAGH